MCNIVVMHHESMEEAMNQFIFNQYPKRKSLLDPLYVPMILGNLAFEEEVKKSTNPTNIKIAVERSNHQIASLNCVVFGEEENQAEANFIYVERLIKTLLWLKGGFRVYIGGSNTLGEAIQKAYSENGSRQFDADFMSKVYQHPFEVKIVSYDEVPAQNEVSKSIGRHLDGYRIGFDAGGSDRKVSSVVNGETIYSEEVVWHPKTQSDPNYHYDGIMDSLKRAASKMPRVDAIGVSSAGIFIDNQVAVASLFIKVSQEDFDKKIRNMYFDIQKEFQGVPIEVINDGDVTALAGAMSLESDQVLGIAMGTSEAAGYVDHLGNITGWLNELAFVPVDYNPEGPLCDWSLDHGVGVSYFSQDAVIKLAKAANIDIPCELSPAEKLKIVQSLMAQNDKRAREIFETIGMYLGYTLAYYARFYECKYVLILGRVTSGEGGNIILTEAKKVLQEEFPQLSQKMTITLPDEKNRRVGQSIAAASLPEIK